MRAGRVRGKPRRWPDVSLSASWDTPARIINPLPRVRQSGSGKGRPARSPLRHILLLQALKGFCHEVDELGLADGSRGKLVVDRGERFLPELLGEIVLVPAVDLAGRGPCLD